MSLTPNKVGLHQEITLSHTVLNKSIKLLVLATPLAGLTEHVEPVMTPRGCVLPLWTRPVFTSSCSSPAGSRHLASVLLLFWTLGDAAAAPEPCASHRGESEAFSQRLFSDICDCWIYHQHLFSPLSATCNQLQYSQDLWGSPATMGDVVSSHLDESRREMITGKTGVPELQLKDECRQFPHRLTFLTSYFSQVQNSSANFIVFLCPPVG